MCTLDSFLLESDEESTQVSRLNTHKTYELTSLSPSSSQNSNCSTVRHPCSPPLHPTNKLPSHHALHELTKSSRNNGSVTSLGIVVKIQWSACFELVIPRRKCRHHHFDPLRTYPSHPLIFSLIDMTLTLSLISYLQYFFYLNQLLALILSFLLRIWLWKSRNAYFELDALQFSLVGGRIDFSGLRYISRNQSLRVGHGLSFLLFL